MKFVDDPKCGDGGVARIGGGEVRGPHLRRCDVIFLDGDELMIGEQRDEAIPGGDRETVQPQDQSGRDADHHRETENTENCFEKQENILCLRVSVVTRNRAPRS